MTRRGFHTPFWLRPYIILQLVVEAPARLRRPRFWHRPNRRGWPVQESTGGGGAVSHKKQAARAADGEEPTRPSTHYINETCAFASVTGEHARPCEASPVNWLAGVLSDWLAGWYLAAARVGHFGVDLFQFEGDRKRVRNGHWGALLNPFQRPRGSEEHFGVDS